MLSAMAISFTTWAPLTSTANVLCLLAGNLRIGSEIEVALNEVGADPVTLNTDPDVVIVASYISVPSPKTFTVIPGLANDSASTFTKAMLVNFGKTISFVLKVKV